jgi:NADPH:quinone reductase-like Zn-dependent oxidoreductase
VVQLAKAFGAIVIATAGTDAKVEFCRQLGADHAVNYRENDFVAYVDDVTDGPSTGAISSSASPPTSPWRNSRSASSRASTATSTSSASASPSSTIPD